MSSASATTSNSPVRLPYKATYRISLADAFAAALVKEKKAELVTGDPEFKLMEKEIKITWLKSR